MKIDIIIPIYKPGKKLSVLLDRLGEQSVPIHKIILMNTGKEYFAEWIPEDTFAQRYPRVEVHHLEKTDFDHGGTRHEAIGYSEAEIFVMMTQDAMPVDRYLVERLAQNLTGRVAVAYARQLPDEFSSELEKASRQFNYPKDSGVKGMEDLQVLGIKTFFCSNVCAAYNREIYDKTGGFEPHTIFNEDMLYAAKVVKAGYQIAYEALAQVIHSHNYTNLQQLHRNFDLGVSQAQHPEVFELATSESEGLRLVKGTWNFLKEKKRLYRFPGFCVQCAFKYTGYLLGKHYKRLPHSLVLRLTSNREYWTIKK